MCNVDPTVYLILVTLSPSDFCFFCCAHIGSSARYCSWSCSGSNCESLVECRCDRMHGWRHGKFLSSEPSLGSLIYTCILICVFLHLRALLKARNTRLPQILSTPSQSYITMCLMKVSLLQTVKMLTLFESVMLLPVLSGKSCILQHLRATSHR